MTIVTSSESVLAAARVSYARDQAQQSALTGAKVNSNPTNADLIANDPTLENAIEAAENTTTVTVNVGGGGGGHGGGAGGVHASASTAGAGAATGDTSGQSTAGSAPQAPAATVPAPTSAEASQAVVTSVNVTA